MLRVFPRLSQRERLLPGQEGVHREAIGAGLPILGQDLIQKRTLAHREEASRYALIKMYCEFRPEIHVKSWALLIQ